MTKKTYTIIAVIIILLIIGLVWWRGMRKEQVPVAQETAQQSDTTTAIKNDIAGIDVGNTETDFKTVDQSINSL